MSNGAYYGCDRCGHAIEGVVPGEGPAANLVCDRCGAGMSGPTKMPPSVWRADCEKRWRGRDVHESGQRAFLMANLGCEVVWREEGEPADTSIGRLFLVRDLVDCNDNIPGVAVVSDRAVYMLDLRYIAELYSDEAGRVVIETDVSLPDW